MASQILVHALTRGFGFSIPSSVVSVKNLDVLAEAGSDYDVLVCAESKVSDRRHLSDSISLIWLPPTEACQL